MMSPKIIELGPLKILSPIKSMMKIENTVRVKFFQTLGEKNQKSYQCWEHLFKGNGWVLVRRRSFVAFLLVLFQSFTLQVWDTFKKPKVIMTKTNSLIKTRVRTMVVELHQNLFPRRMPLFYPSYIRDCGILPDSEFTQCKSYFPRRICKNN